MLFRGPAEAPRPLLQDHAGILAAQDGFSNLDPFLDVVPPRFTHKNCSKQQYCIYTCTRKLKIASTNLQSFMQDCIAILLVYAEHKDQFHWLVHQRISIVGQQHLSSFSYRLKTHVFNFCSNRESLSRVKIHIKHG